MKFCPKCQSANTVKNGFLRETQRKRCKDCGYQFTKAFCGKASPDIKKQALSLYLEGLGFRSIGRFLKCSHVSVYNWIRDFSFKLESLKKEAGIEIMQVDEMHTYMGSKKTIAGSGLPLIDMERSLSTVSSEIEARKQGTSYGKK